MAQWAYRDGASGGSANGGVGGVGGVGAIRDETHDVLEYQPTLYSQWGL